MNFRFSPSKTQWVKFAHIQDLSFVGRDVACASSGCHMLFINLKTGEETIFRVNDASSGDSVGCVTGHRSSRFFAYSEKLDKPRIFMMSYPEMKRITTLKTQSSSYISMVFSEVDLFMALGGFPEHTLHVFKWMIGEKLLSVDTRQNYMRQILKTNFGTPVCMSQCITDTNLLFLWEFAMCGRKCVMTKEHITYRDTTCLNNFRKALWTTEGGLFVIDEKAHVYMMSQDNKLDRVITWENEGIYFSFFTWFQNGFLINGPDGALKHYIKSGDWTSDWKIDSAYTLKYSMAAIGKDNLIALSNEDDLLVYDSAINDFKLMRSDESGISEFSMIFPMAEYIVTLAHDRKMFLWRVETGQMVDQFEAVDKNILKICSNPYYPYVSATYDSGLLEMYACFDDRMLQMASFQLCRIPLQKISYSEKGSMIIVANTDIGQFFIIEGVPGGKFKVIRTITANVQIIDYILVGSKPCMRLFMIFATSDRYLAGNGIWRYCIVKHQEPTLKRYELENPNRLYNRLYITWKAKNRDRVFYAVPLDAKNLHEIETKRGDTHARIIDRIKSNHLMKHIKYKWNDDHLITYAYDGLIMLKDYNFVDIRDVVMPHHRMDGGVKVAFSDPHGRLIVSLGRDGVLVCTHLSDHYKNADTTSKMEAKMQSYMNMFSKPSIGFNPTGIYEGKSWLECEELIKVESDRIRFEKERRSIMKDLKKIRSEVTRLLDKNLNGPENEYLDLQEFDMDIAKREEKIKASNVLCEQTKVHLKNQISENERVAKLIKENYWDTIDTQTRNMWSIFGNFDVQSYCMLHRDGEQDERLLRIEEFRMVEQMLSNDDLFAPWNCTAQDDLEEHLEMEPKLVTEEPHPFDMNDDDVDFEDLTDEEKEKLQEQHLIEMEHYTAFAATTTHIFVPANKHHYSQFEQQAFYQHLQEFVIGKSDQQNLREFFNEKFENIFQSKIREMGTIIEKNARLRYILSELNYFSEEQLDISIADPEWKQDENPERLTVVNNEEVGITPYISPSEQALLDIKAAEAERIRLLLLADDFKERALMAMMNGVLEIRWEDELRKDVQKPKCVLEKEPEDYTEEDLRAIKDYEEKVVFLQSERERYKVILTNEYAKVGSQVREGVRKFNERLQDLLLLKLQIESAITQEVLRTSRLRKWGLQRNYMEIEEQRAIDAIKQSEIKTDEFHKIVGSLHTCFSEIRNNLEIAQNKDKFIDKSFKKEFQDVTSAQIEVLSKLYKKRPKANLRAITSPCILNELATSVIANTKSVLLNAEALEFVKLLEVLDRFMGIPSAIDAGLYAVLCRQRRIKIENELRIRALQLDLSEAEGTSVLHHKALSRSKEETQRLYVNLEVIRNKKIQTALDMELQVVLREGYVEIPRTGSLEDFTDAIMISREVVEEINKIITKTGLKKIKAMKAAMNFKNEILMMEWEHRRRKMEIVDLKSHFIDVGSVNVTKEIQSFLKTRARGGSTDKVNSFDDEVENMKNLYIRMINERKEKVEKLDERIAALKIENRHNRKEIKEINVDVNEYRLNINDKLLKENEKITRLRMAAHMKRSKLITQIQTNQQELFVLQTELELLRLRTVPVLEYKVEV